VDPRRAVPRTDTVLADPRLADVTARLGRERVKAAVVSAQEAVRQGALAAADVVDATLDALPRTATTLRPVLNATGVLLHTNLGRAPLSAAARAALEVAAGTCDVELDLATGERGPRGAGAIDALLAAVPAAAAAHVANNGAAALALVALTLAQGREMVVARGELVEIGDGFRIPALLEATGARLREVGTTNRVTRADYAAAIGEDTAFVLKVHPSNFVVRGFTSACGVDELAGLGVPVVADIGSGLLAPHPLLPDEPDAATALAQGAAIVTASGDKLLGGPQCGIIAGSEATVSLVRRHPLMRAFRVDKMISAALEATLAEFDAERSRTSIPVAAMIAMPVAVIGQRADALAARLAEAGLDATVIDGASTIGGGSAPGSVLPTRLVAIASDPIRLEAALRSGDPAVVARIEHDRLVLDLRTVPTDQDEQLGTLVVGAFGLRS